MPVTYGESLPVFPTYIPAMRGLQPDNLIQDFVGAGADATHAMAAMDQNRLNQAQARTGLDLEPRRALALGSTYDLQDAQNQTGLTLEPLRAQQVGSGYQAQTAQNQTTMQLEPQRRVALGNQYDLQATQADQSNQAALATPEVPLLERQRQGWNAATVAPVDSFINGKMERTTYDIHGNKVLTQDLGLGGTGPIIQQLNHPPTEVIDSGDGKGGQAVQVRKINGVYYDRDMNPLTYEQRVNAIIGPAPTQTLQDQRQDQAVKLKEAGKGIVPLNATEELRNLAVHNQIQGVPNGESVAANKVNVDFTKRADIAAILKAQQPLITASNALNSAVDAKTGLPQVALVGDISKIFQGGKATDAEYGRLAESVGLLDRWQQFVQHMASGKPLTENQLADAREVINAMAEHNKDYYDTARKPLFQRLGPTISQKGLQDVYIPPLPLATGEVNTAAAATPAATVNGKVVPGLSQEQVDTYKKMLIQKGVAKQ